MVKLGVVGAGHWGSNLINNFHKTNNCQLVAICDLDSSLLDKHRSLGINLDTNLNNILPHVDAVAIAVNSPLHHQVAKRCLEAGKHVYVEKPMTVTSQQGRELVNIAKSKNLKLMVGHLLMYHPAVEYLKQMIDSGELGNIRYMYTKRLNLGTVRPSESSWWSLAPHDISVILHLFGQSPVSVLGSGKCWLQEDVQDTVFATLNFQDGRMAHIHVSWLDPHKERTMTIVGDKRMVTFDDIQPTEKIRIYDKGAEKRVDSHGFQLRAGDITVPAISMHQPLSKECQHFIDSVVNDTTPLSDGYNGLEVIKILEAVDKSIEEGREVYL